MSCRTATLVCFLTDLRKNMENYSDNGSQTSNSTFFYYSLINLRTLQCLRTEKDLTIYIHTYVKKNTTLFRIDRATF